MFNYNDLWPSYVETALLQRLPCRRKIKRTDGQNKLINSLFPYTLYAAHFKPKFMLRISIISMISYLSQIVNYHVRMLGIIYQ